MEEIASTSSQLRRVPSSLEAVGGDEILPGFGVSPTAHRAGLRGRGSNELSENVAGVPSLVSGYRNGNNNIALAACNPCSPVHSHCNPVKDELQLAAPEERVMAISEQISEFLLNFSAHDRRTILEPFVNTREFDLEDASCETESPKPHIDEARRFVTTFLAASPQNERTLALSHVSASCMKSPKSGVSTESFLDMRRHVRTKPARIATHAITACNEFIRLSPTSDSSPKKHQFFLPSPSGASSSLISTAANASIKGSAKVKTSEDDGVVKSAIARVFRRFDQDDSGQIQRCQLQCVIQALDPSFTHEDMDILMGQWRNSDAIDYAGFVDSVFVETTSVRSRREPFNKSDVSEHINGDR